VDIIKIKTGLENVA